MVNKNYIKGRRYEYKVQKMLEKKGYIACRTAGSHSPFDIIGIHRQKRIVVLVQCKAGKFSEKEKQKLLNDNIDLHIRTFLVNFFVNPDVNEI